MDPINKFKKTPPPPGNAHIMALGDLIWKGDLLEISRIAKLGKEHINECCYEVYWGITALTCACNDSLLRKEDKLAIVKILLAEGADVNILSRGALADSFTPASALWIAAGYKDGPCCQLLMDHGALLYPRGKEESQTILQLIADDYARKYASLSGDGEISSLPKELQKTIFSFLKRLHTYPVNYIFETSFWQKK